MNPCFPPIFHIGSSGMIDGVEDVIEMAWRDLVRSNFELEENRSLWIQTV